MKYSKSNSLASLIWSLDPVYHDLAYDKDTHFHCIELTQHNWVLDPSKAQLLTLRKATWPPPWSHQFSCKTVTLHPRGVHSLLYFAYTYIRDLFIGGVIYLAKRIIRRWCFTCKEHAILYVMVFYMYTPPPKLASRVPIPLLTGHQHPSIPSIDPLCALWACPLWHWIMTNMNTMIHLRPLHSVILRKEKKLYTLMYFYIIYGI